MGRPVTYIRFYWLQSAREGGGAGGGPRLQNRMERGARALLVAKGQLKQISVKEKLDELEKSMDTTLGT
eukprot:COSAG06_NODE_5689_length_3318_cov_24.544337_2_plen_69_part_00